MVEGVFYTFWFEKNLQGDIVAVYNSVGTKLVSYNYDAWGNCTTTNHNISGTNSYATYNPFRYRGYYFDSELGFYYLNSRYYDPAVGRFINADTLVSTGQGILGYNMFAYCNNNPTLFCDCSGDCPHRPEHLGDCQECLAGISPSSFEYPHYEVDSHGAIFEKTSFVDKTKNALGNIAEKFENGFK